MSDREALVAIFEGNWGGHEEIAYPEIMTFVAAHLKGEGRADKMGKDALAREERERKRHAEFMARQQESE